MNKNVIDAMNSINSIDRLQNEAYLDVHNAIMESQNKYQIIKEHGTVEYAQNEFYQESVLAGVLIGLGVIGLIVSTILIIKKVNETSGKGSGKSSKESPSGDVNLLDQKSVAAEHAKFKAKFEELVKKAKELGVTEPERKIIETLNLKRAINVEAYNKNAEALEKFINNIGQFLELDMDSDEYQSKAESLIQEIQTNYESIKNFVDAEVEIIDVTGSPEEIIDKIYKSFEAIENAAPKFKAFDEALDKVNKKANEIKNKAAAAGNKAQSGENTESANKIDYTAIQNKLNSVLNNIGRAVTATYEKARQGFLIDTKGIYSFDVNSLKSETQTTAQSENTQTQSTGTSNEKATNIQVDTLENGTARKIIEQRNQPVVGSPEKNDKTEQETPQSVNNKSNDPYHIDKKEESRNIDIFNNNKKYFDSIGSHTYTEAKEYINKVFNASPNEVDRWLLARREKGDIDCLKMLCDVADVRGLTSNQITIAKGVITNNEQTETPETKETPAEENQETPPVQQTATPEQPEPETTPAKTPTNDLTSEQLAVREKFLKGGRKKGAIKDSRFDKLSEDIQNEINKGIKSLPVDMIKKYASSGSKADTYNEIVKYMDQQNASEEQPETEITPEETPKTEGTNTETPTEKPEQPVVENKPKDEKISDENSVDEGDKAVFELSTAEGVMLNANLISVLMAENTAEKVAEEVKKEEETVEKVSAEEIQKTAEERNAAIVKAVNQSTFSITSTLLTQLGKIKNSEQLKKIGNNVALAKGYFADKVEKIKASKTAAKHKDITDGVEKIITNLGKAEEELTSRGIEVPDSEEMFNNIEETIQQQAATLETKETPVEQTEEQKDEKPSEELFQSLANTYNKPVDEVKADYDKMHTGEMSKDDVRAKLDENVKEPKIQGYYKKIFKIATGDTVDGTIVAPEKFEAPVENPVDKKKMKEWEVEIDNSEQAMYVPVIPNFSDPAELVNYTRQIVSDLPQLYKQCIDAKSINKAEAEVTINNITYKKITPNEFEDSEFMTLIKEFTGYADKLINDINNAKVKSQILNSKLVVMGRTIVEVLENLKSIYSTFEMWYAQLIRFVNESYNFTELDKSMDDTIKELKSLTTNVPNTQEYVDRVKEFRLLREGPAIKPSELDKLAANTKSPIIAKANADLNTKIQNAADKAAADKIIADEEAVARKAKFEADVKQVNENIKKNSEAYSKREAELQQAFDDDTRAKQEMKNQVLQDYHNDMKSMKDNVRQAYADDIAAREAENKKAEEQAAERVAANAKRKTDNEKTKQELVDALHIKRPEELSKEDINAFKQQLKDETTAKYAPTQTPQGPNMSMNADVSQNANLSAFTGHQPTPENGESAANASAILNMDRTELINQLSSKYNTNPTDIENNIKMVRNGEITQDALNSASIDHPELADYYRTISIMASDEQPTPADTQQAAAPAPTEEPEKKGVFGTIVNGAKKFGGKIINAMDNKLEGFKDAYKQQHGEVTDTTNHNEMYVLPNGTEVLAEFATVTFEDGTVYEFITNIVE